MKQFLYIFRRIHILPKRHMGYKSRLWGKEVVRNSFQFIAVRLIAFVFLLFLSSSAYADFVEVGGGTSGISYVPVYGFYDYSWSRAVYLQSELGDAKILEKIAYQLYTSPSGYVMPNQQIWMKHTTDAAITSNAYTDPGANGFTKVFDGTIDFTGTMGDWFEIEFNVADFDYNGTDNLIVIWENRDGDWASGYPRWYYNSMSSRVAYKYADGSFPATNGTVAVYLPNTRFYYTPPPPIGVLHGLVENTATGNPVVGAAITATETTSMDEYTWMSGESGEYYFPLNPGTYDLVFTKIGFTGAAQNGLVVVAGDTTEVPDVSMTEIPYEPMFVEATVNATDDACLVEWGLPSGDYEIVYDDGVAENFIAWNNEGNMNAVKFMPAGYPAVVKGGKIYIGDGSYPEGGDFLNIDFGVAVYAADGENGLPGTLLDSIVVTPTDYGWVNFMGLNAEVLSGDFYIAMVQGGNYPNCAPVGIDQTPPQKYRSYSCNQSLGGTWGVSAYQDFMIRAIVEGSNSGNGDFARAATIWPAKITGYKSQNPTNTTFGKEGSAEYKIVSGSGTRGVDHYMVYRVSNFDPEDPMDPGTETLLNNNVSGLSYIDNGFGAQPNGYFRYNVYATYESGEVSDAAVSNVVAHNMSYEVTFEITTTDGNSPEGAHVLMTGLDYPYEIYEDYAPASGTVVFEDVWDGTYNYMVSLNGYDTLAVSNVTIDEETTITIILAETKNPPRGLYVDETTQVATWAAPGGFDAGIWKFDSGIPADFAIVNGGTCNATWGASIYGGGLDGTQIAFVNSDGAGSSCGTMDEELITPVVACSGVSAVLLDFDQYFQQHASSIGDVDVWDGSAWQTVYSISSNLGGWGAPNHQSIDILAYANAELKVRFHYYNADWDYWWAIDNVKVWDGVFGDNGRNLSSYNVYLDGAWVSSTAPDVLTWAYTDLNFGQTYIAGVGAVYSSGVSEINTYEFTAAFLPPPRNLSGEHLAHDVYLNWDFPLAGGPYGDGDRSDILVSASADAESHVGNTSNGSTTDAQFDLQFSYDVDTPSGLTGLAGAETDGNFFYVTKWADNQIAKFNMDGSFVETFSIGGVSGLRDLAYDGTYFYGSAASTTIWEMDFNNQILISTISSPSAARAIAYDSGANGFWVNNWDSPLTLVSRSGATLNVINNPPSIYGMAYENISENGPFLWLFSGTESGAGCQIEQMDITSANLTGISHSVSGDLGAAGIAGGLWIQPDISGGTTTIGGLMQASPDILFGYELLRFGGMAENLIGYNIYRDGGFIAQTDEETFSYTDIQASAGAHEYSVAAVYEAPTAGESLEEGPISIFVDVSGHISGNVSVDYENHVPVEGAVVTAYKYDNGDWIYENEALTDENGNYSFIAFEDCYKLVCEATGYQTVDTFNICSFYLDTTYVDFVLPEDPLAPNWVVAERNFEHTQLDLSWSVPSNNYEIYYDNNTPAYFSCWNVGGNMNALKFTAAGYPCTVMGGQLNIGDGTWPEGVNLQPFTIMLALADGEAGMPGTLLNSIDITPTHYGWLDFTFAEASIVAQGDFYLIMKQSGDYPNCTPIAVDSTSHAHRSYSRDVVNGENWQLSAYQDFMIRAQVYSPIDGLMMLGFEQELNQWTAAGTNTVSQYKAEPALLKTQKAGKYRDISGKTQRELESYLVYRLNEGDENSPDLWTLLIDQYQSTTYTDFDWTSLAEGWYRYAVIADYSFSQSDVSFSNAVPRLLDVEVMINITTNTGVSPEGAFAELTGIGNPYYFSAEAPQDGATLLHEVWKEHWYKLTVSKPGYETFVLENIFINQDLNLDVVLNEACLPPQNFDVTMDGQASWLPPVIENQEIFSEGFEGEAIPTGWTQITEPNGNPDLWFVQSGGASGHPQNAYEGSYNAFFNGSSAITKLVTPSIDLGGAINPVLKFWYAQPANQGQDKLSVFYRTSADADWVSIDSKSADVPFWTFSSVDLPNPTSDYYIAFEGYAPESGGYGISLDDISIEIATTPGDDRFVEGYNVYLNGEFIDFTEELAYTYTGLNPGQTYLAGLSAVYDHCESQLVYDAFIFHDCSFFEPVENLEAMAIEADAQLAWDYPGGLEPQEYDIVYTDNTAENATAWNVVNSENALRMTPAAYPCDILSVSVNIFNGSWPTGNILTPMEVLVYAGDGAGGLPGTVLGSKVVTPADYNWVEVDMSDLGITITDGDFYVSHKQIGTYPDCPPTAIDENAGVNRSYSRADGDPWGVASYQDFMFKAHVYGFYFGDRILGTDENVLLPQAAHKASVSLHEKSGPANRLVKQGTAHYIDNAGRSLRALRGYNVFRNGEKITDIMLPSNQLVYTDTPPWGGAYTYEVTAEYDEGHACPESVSVEVNLDLPTPENIFGEALSDTAHLWWSVPEFLDTWLYYDDGIYTSSIGAGEAEFDVAIRFPVESLQVYDGFALTKVRIFFATSGINSEYTGRIWTKEGDNEPVLIKEFEIVEANINWDAWNDFELDTAISIDASKELWFGYYIDEPDGDFAAAGSNVANDGLGNMIYYGGSWATLLELAPALDYNWMIRAQVIDMPGGREYLMPLQSTRSYSSALDLSEKAAMVHRVTRDIKAERALLGYNIYRDGYDYPINQSLLTDTNYYDLDLDPGAYEYFVTAAYSAGNSMPSDTVEVQILSDNQHFVPVWNGNPLDPMTITVNGAYFADLPLEANDEIGVFDGDFCVGAALLSQSIDPENNETYVYISCSKDDPATTEIEGYTAGNAITYKIWDFSAEDEKESVFVSFPYPEFTFTDFTPNETAVVILNAYDHIQQQIDLVAGWNMVSWNVSPVAHNMMDVLSSLIEDEELIKVQDEGGNIMQQMPWGWTNNIGEIANTEGYYMKVEEECVLNTNGSILALPYNIPLSSGWNMMGWPAQSPALALDALSELIDNGLLVKVIDEQGNVLEEFPWGWVNNIGNLSPGEGYQVKVNQSCIYAADLPAGDRLAMMPPIEKTRYFQLANSGNPYYPMTFALENKDVLPQGAELAVFDGEQCVAASVVQGDYIYLTASMDESTTSFIEGFKEGSLPQFKYYNVGMSKDQKINVGYLEGDRTFTKRGTFVGSLKDALDMNDLNKDFIPVVAAFPNPVHHETIISYELNMDANVQLQLNDIHGRSLGQLLNAKQPAGEYQLVLDMSQKPAGVYYLQTLISTETGMYNQIIRIVKL